MQRVNGYILYQLGVAIGVLEGYLRTEGVQLSGLLLPAQTADWFLDYLTGAIVPLKGSKQIAESLRGFIKETIVDPARTQPTTIPSVQDRTLLVNTISNFQAVLASAPKKTRRMSLSIPAMSSPLLEKSRLAADPTSPAEPVISATLI